uniref:Uncharacterized protein n=1 Tax=Oryza punctata TaxID=4537 RepID=A0A0E0KP72_ORYPU
MLQKSEEWMRHRANKLKENVRRLFWTSNDVVARMNLVDSIQHLGIGHLFDDEISHTLNDIYQSEFTSSSLHEVALRFRLLRGHGLWVSADVFNKFKGDDGRFINKLASEPRGLLSLYNAAYLLIHDEPELEEAISFSRYHLKSMMQGSDVKQPLVNQISRALRLPLPRTYKRVETLHYLSEYGQEEGHIPILLDLAKLDFNLLQRVHLKELKAISEWSKDLYRYMGLSYIRERVVEAYTWSYMMYYEEDFALTRMFVAKLIALGTVMDDTYDAHATIQECRLLNTAIQRWDDSAISILPEYLKKFYHKLLINFKEFEDQVAANEKYRVAYTKQEFQKQSAYYLQEAEWSNEKHKPSFQDQVVLSTKSSAVQLVCVAAAVGWGDAMTAEAFEWASSGNATVVACAKIGRFLNDIAAFKRGKNRGDVASSVECYMNENGVTSDVAFAKIDLLIEDEWRTMNLNRFEHQEMLPIVQRVVNFAVSLVLFYDGRMDAYTFAPLLTEVIKSLFVRPIPIS